jgi:hypothetical protein
VVSAAKRERVYILHVLIVSLSRTSYPIGQENLQSELQHLCVGFIRAGRRLKGATAGAV